MLVRTTSTDFSGSPVATATTVPSTTQVAVFAGESCAGFSDASCAKMPVARSSTGKNRIGFGFILSIVLFPDFIKLDLHGLGLLFGHNDAHRSRDVRGRIVVIVDGIAFNVDGHRAIAAGHYIFND